MTHIFAHSQEGIPNPYTKFGFNTQKRSWEMPLIPVWWLYCSFRLAVTEKQLIELCCRTTACFVTRSKYIRLKSWSTEKTLHPSLHSGNATVHCPPVDIYFAFYSESVRLVLEQIRAWKMDKTHSSKKCDVIRCKRRTEHHYLVSLRCPVWLTLIIFSCCDRAADKC